MQNKDEQLPPLGVCWRFFNFISRLVSPLMHSAPPVSTQIPVTNGVVSTESSTGEKMKEKTSKDSETLGSEIEIHFKQTEEEDLKYWTPIDKLGSSVYVDHHHPNQFKEKKSKIIELPPPTTKDKAKANKSRIGEASRNQELPRADPTSRGKGFRETPQVAQGESAQKIINSTKKEGKKIASEEISVATQAKGPKMRKGENILSANINEKSDAFLRSRKEAMRRNLGLAPDAE